MLEIDIPFAFSLLRMIYMTLYPFIVVSPIVTGACPIMQQSATLLIFIQSLEYEHPIQSSA